MSPFVSKGVRSCARDVVFSGLTLFLSSGGRERKLQCSVLHAGCKLGWWAREVWGCTGWRQKEGLVSSSAESLGMLLGSVTLWDFCFSSKRSSRSVTHWPQFVLTSVRWPDAFCRLWAGGRQLQPASDRPILDTWTKRLQDFPRAFPLWWSADRRVTPGPGEVPCMARQARRCVLGGAAAPRRQLVTFLVILCRKGVPGVLWLFSLDHLSAAVFNELEKK